MTVEFTKYSGCGNDFIVVDNRDLFFPTDDSDQTRWLCHRHLGIGADGIVLWEDDSEADARMRIFNADGGLATMCGNGLRCLYHHICAVQHSQQPATIATDAGPHRLWWEESQIVIQLPAARIHDWNCSLQIDGIPCELSWLDTGVAHVVLFADPIFLPSLGPQLRHHPHFGIDGVNVNIAKELEPGLLQLRTYERGVEGETLACGTGATATALAYAHHTQYSKPVRVQVASDEILTIFPNPDHPTLAGNATRVFTGRINPSTRNFLPEKLMATTGSTSPLTPENQ